MLEKLSNIVLGALFTISGLIAAAYFHLVELPRMERQREAFQATLNHDRSVTCGQCGRLPQVWEDAFPRGICEDCVWENEA